MRDPEDNPYCPGIGKTPPYRAGHKVEADRLEVALGRIRKRRAGDAVVLYGPRGNGKTVLLGELRDNSRKADLRIASLNTSEMTGDPAQFAKLLAPKRWFGFSGIKSLMAGASGFTAGIEFKDSPVARAEATLRRILEKSPFVLIIDEAHDIPPEMGKAILQATQNCISDNLPLLVAMAGTPDLPSRFQEMGASFWERCLKLRIGRLESDDATRAAFSVPAERTGFSFSDDALDLLVRECQGYPYFVQFLGEATWKASNERAGNDDRLISLQDARQGVASSKTFILDFYKERYAEARKRLILPEAVAVSDAMSSVGDGALISGKELGNTLRKVTADEASLQVARSALTHLGLIWETPEGNWESGIPSLCSYFSMRGVE